MKYFLWAALSLGAGAAHAQTVQDSVKATIQDLFRGMITADGALVRSVFGDSAVMQTIVTRKDGATQIVNESVDAFGEQVSKMVKGIADERITFGNILIDGPLAMAWTPYEFYYKGQFSHCGVNSFQLVRGEKGWKIQYLIDTRRKQGCR